MAANTYTQTVLGSGLQTSIVAAQTALQALISATATYQNSPIAYNDLQLDVVYGGATPAIGYNAWAWISYYSAS